MKAVLVGLGLLAVIGGCRKSAERAAPTESASISSSASAPSSASVAAPMPSARAVFVLGEIRVGKVKITDAARQLLLAWDAALNAHDVSLLEAVYAPSLDFYGRNLARAQVLSLKRASLAAAPDFKQTLSNVRFVPAGDANVYVEFDKTSSGQKVSARLLVEPYGPVYAIVRETDAPAEQLQRARMSCEEAMYYVASALPEVKRVDDEAGPDARPGGMFYPEEGKHRSISLGFNHEDRVENVYYADWEDGVFSVHSGYTGEQLAIPPADQALVRAQCPK